MSDGWTSSPWGEPAPADADMEETYNQPWPDRNPTGRTVAGPRTPSLVGHPTYGRRTDFGYWRAFRITRASLGLIIIALGLGLALAAGLGTLVWAIAAALHHAASQ